MNWKNIVLVSLVGAVWALPAQEVKVIQFGGIEWSYLENEGSTVRVEKFLDRDALFLQRMVAARNGDHLKDVVIEYEYASTHQSGFIGVNFRDDLQNGNLEQFYTRPHQTGQPDATQYMVMVNGVATWQLHAGPNDAVAKELPAREWIKVRIVAIGDKADIFVDDMTTPLIHVPDLRYDGGTGSVSLYSADRPWRRETGAYFSNIRIRPAGSDDRIVGAPKEVEPLPAGLVTKFAVSSPFSESDLDQSALLQPNTLDSMEWVELAVENDGVANLARTAPISEGRNTVFVKMKIPAQKGQLRQLRFGYSDRVRLYINSRPVYSGNAQWRARDHRFLGTVSLADAIVLPDADQDIEVIAAVSESFGGWGFKAVVEAL